MSRKEKEEVEIGHVKITARWKLQVHLMGLPNVVSPRSSSNTVQYDTQKN